VKLAERFRLLLALAGIIVVGYLIVRVGPVAVWSIFRDLSWRVVLILVFPTCLAVVADTLGWYFTFVTLPHSFGRLIGMRLAGEAVNQITPTASVGGDLVRALLLRPEVPLREAVASVIADKTTGVTSQVLLLLAGLLVLAFIEAGLALMYFMHLRYERRSFAWSLILAVLVTVLLMDHVWFDAFRLLRQRLNTP